MTQWAHNIEDSGQDSVGHDASLVFTMTALLLTVVLEDIATLLHVYVSYFINISCTTDLWTYLTLHFHQCPEGEAVSRPLRRARSLKDSWVSVIR